MKARRYNVLPAGYESESSESEQVRHIRTERSEPVQVDTEESTQWAVSYSDLLMVMMAFFVIFFSFEDTQKTETSPQPSSPQLSATQPTVINQAPRTVETIVDTIVGSLSGLDVTRTAHSEVTIKIPEITYEKGQFGLNEASKDTLRSILSRLKPYQGNLRIEFIGHTDATLVILNKSKFIENNFDLSALRAAKALQFAVSEGFLPENLYVRGAASNLQLSRTLSVVVSPKETQR